MVVVVGLLLVACPPAGAVAGATTLGGGVSTVAVATGAGATASVGGGISAGGAGVAVAVTGPVAIAGLLVGASPDCITWDCWKQVIHDSSIEASSGMELSELLSHDNVESSSITDSGMVVFNKFCESFNLSYVDVPGFGLALHASLIAGPVA